MKEFEKLLLEDTKRKITEKAKLEVQLGLFEQKKEVTFDLSNYTLMTYDKKYKGLYDLYQHNDTKALVFVCPLVENNKGDEGERPDLKPYAYDVLYLETLSIEQYEQVQAASAHENSSVIDLFYKIAFVLYFVSLGVTLCLIIAASIYFQEMTNVFLVCGTMISMQVLYTALMPLIMIQYRKFKAE
ncbi:MAG TPA: hypothetical protein IAD46_05030 [Candidatus Pelethenecus faecipullorum]|uniref:Uncharacterized protein n=1 Tax=Candidatus Pelethenecus faecipullorum TaxID=2840900 RepID=A0A9D1KJ99_9MOLU|nr:hypothetical protein [Candidatus Pelethenecus faecipullorum]